jgi:hypothetical protein
MNDRETATVLAALRFWQEEILDDGGIFAARRKSPDHFNGVEPLCGKEVDALCERINLGEEKVSKSSH